LWGGTQGVDNPQDRHVLFIPDSSVLMAFLNDDATMWHLIRTELGYIRCKFIISAYQIITLLRYSFPFLPSRTQLIKNKPGTIRRYISETTGECLDIGTLGNVRWNKNK